MVSETIIYDFFLKFDYDLRHLELVQCLRFTARNG